MAGARVRLTLIPRSQTSDATAQHCRGYATDRRTGWPLDRLAPHAGLLATDPLRKSANGVSFRVSPRRPALGGVFMGPSPERMLAPKQVRDRWSRMLAGTGRRTGERILIEANGDLQQDQFERLLRSRDDRSMDLQE